MKHLAVIMDGNRRWAEKRDLPVFEGHRAGVKALKQIVKASIDHQINHLTVYAFSTENWSRKAQEVEFIFSLFREVLERELPELLEQGVRLIFLGDHESLKPSVRELIEIASTKSQDKNALNLNIALNYGARLEISKATQQLAQKVLDNEISITDINEQSLKNHLYTADTPEPDLLIRTGGEQRISNFLLWQIAYTEIIFMPVLWPDFRENHLQEALQEYSKRVRRFGE